ncbi:hypothetical protein [Bergeyella sp. RCAD1439]|nr:hypothetical protein [Bergeyella sp. RCAD1439]
MKSYTSAVELRGLASLLVLRVDRQGGKVFGDLVVQLEILNQFKIG